MPSTPSWPTADDADRRVRIIDDLLGAILVLAALVFAALLELTRRRVCAVYQLAFLLCACCAVFIVGGLVDHHLTDEQLQLALYGSFLSSTLTTTYVYLPLGASAAALLVAGAHLSQCCCDCCCLSGSRNASHRECFTARLRANAALYLASFMILWVLIGIRLNARLRVSAINPVGGTVHWLLLRSPFCLTVSHIGSIAIVELKLFLQHADKPRDVSAHSAFSLRQNIPTTLTANQAEAMASTVEKLMQPPPISKIRSPTTSHAPSTGMSTTATTAAAARRLSRPQTPVKSPDSASAIGIVTKLSKAPSLPTAIKKENGDVSELISSDSESDEDVLTPNFTTATRPKAPNPAASAGTTRGYSSDYSTSRPASPALSSLSSRSSSSSNSSSSSRSRLAPRYLRPSDKILTRTRSAASEHTFDSRSYLSDNEDASGKIGYYYYSDSNNNRPSSASSTTSSFSTLSSLSTSTSMSVEGIRRRIPHTNAADAVRAVVSATSGASLSNKSPWVEYFDATSGNPYMYNQITGESRWKSEFRGA